MVFTDILNQYNIPFRRVGEDHHAREGWVQLVCCFCGRGSNKYHLGYNLAFNYCNCYRCGKHSVKEVLRELTQLPWEECSKLLEGLGRPLEREIRPRGRLALPRGLIPLQEAHKRYLRNRGYNPIICCKLWGAEALGPIGRLKWRIYIPVHYKGEVVSWTTRAIGNGTRYISARPEEEAINHKSLLYGEDYCRHAVIVCEGPLDVWRIGPGAVATFGVGFSRAQVLKLAAYPKRVICFDSEPKAQQQARKLCGLLSPYPGETVNVTLEAKDAGEASDKEVKALRKFLS